MLTRIGIRSNQAKNMTTDTLIWPARLHHIHLTSDNVPDMAAWYQDSMGLMPEKLDDGVIWMSGKGRNLLIGPGPKSSLKFSAFAVESDSQLERLRARAGETGTPIESSPTPLFGENAFAIRDPDGNCIVLGMPDRQSAEGVGPASQLPGRLQHVVVASTDAPRMIAFYSDVLGFRKSDLVLEEGGDITACFMRCDPEHHSIAVFRAAENRLDHHCYETTSWNDIRDWGDHFSQRRDIVVWGAGRHGAGHNLFIFVRDPDGNNVELSAEIDSVPYDQSPGEWQHEERTLNLWGSAWLRS
jgi:catechol 2,3-dioxygenase